MHSTTTSPLLAMALSLLAGVLLLCACLVTDARIQGLNAQQAKELIEQYRGDPSFVILDVRTPREFSQGHIAGARLMDFHGPAFSRELVRLDPSKTYLVYCYSGYRSGRALKIMVDKMFTKVYHMSGGIRDWQRRNYPLQKTS